MHTEAPGAAARCIECAQPLAGRFCHRCGQDSARARRPLGELLRIWLSELFNLDGKVFATLRAMMTAPGALLAAYRDGRTQTFVSPIKLFLVVSAAFFVALSWADLAIYQFLPAPEGPGPIGARLAPDGVVIVNGNMEDVFLHPASEGRYATQLLNAMAALRPQADAVQARAIADFSSYIRTSSALNGFFDTWLPRLMWLLLPAYAVLLWPFYRRRSLWEHVLFAIWAHTVMFVLLLAFALLNRTPLRLSFWLLLAPYLGFYVLAARRYYAEGWGRSAVKGVLHMLVFFALAWTPAVLVLVWTVGAQDLPGTVLRADSGPGLFDFYKVILTPEDAAAIRAGREPPP